MSTVTAGNLTAAHLGATVTVTPPAGTSGHGETYTGVLARVQHDAPTDPVDGTHQPAQTLVALGAWSGQLDPTHPITVED